MKGISELKMEPTLRELLDAAVERIVEVAHPQAVILFGSHAQECAHGHSDFDFLVIVDAEDTGELADSLYVALARLDRELGRGLPPYDIIVLTPRKWEYERELPGLLFSRVRRHGVVLHGQAA